MAEVARTGFRLICDVASRPITSERTRGAHGEQQHSQHRSGQEAGGAAEDGGQHRQDKGEATMAAAALGELGLMGVWPRPGPLCGCLGVKSGGGPDVVL